MSYLSQMLGLNVQNFVSAATGMATLVALIRGLRRRTTQNIGNFWVDLTRSTLYILLPLALLLALVQVSQGVVQNFAPTRPYHRCRRPLTATAIPSRSRCCRWVRRRRRSRSSSSAPTVAAFSTSTRRIRSRTRHRCRTSSSCWRSCSSRRRCATPSARWSATRGRAGPCWRR